MATSKWQTFKLSMYKFLADIIDDSYEKLFTFYKVAIIVAITLKICMWIRSVSDQKPIQINKQSQ